MLLVGGEHIAMPMVVVGHIQRRLDTTARLHNNHMT